MSKTKSKRSKFPKDQPEFVNAVRWIGSAIPQHAPNPETGEMFTTRISVSGTGFYLKNKPFLITCYHVVSDFVEQEDKIAEGLLQGEEENKSKVLLVGSPFGCSPASVVAVDIKHDIAILETHVPEELRKEESKIGFQIGKYFPKIGERVAYCGYPLGDALCGETHHPTYAEGAIGSVPRLSKEINRIQISGPIVGGYSGSPIFSRYHQNTFLGMVYQTAPDVRAGQAGIFYGVGYEHIENLARCY